MTPAEVLSKHGIKLGSTASGHYYTTCPRCSHNRTGKEHQKAKVLGVTIKGDAVRWGCNHCNWKGSEKDTNGHAGGFAATYDYRDGDGDLRFQKVRNSPGSSPRFFFRRPDGHGGWINNTLGVDTSLLYRINEVKEAIALGRRIAKPVDPATHSGCATPRVHHRRALVTPVGEKILWLSCSKRARMQAWEVLPV
jgi:hypothetical protein